MDEGSYQKIIGQHSRNDLTAKLCAWMYRVPDESNNEGPLPVMNNGYRRGISLLLGNHQDHCFKRKAKRKSGSYCLGVSQPKRYSALWDLTDICRSTAPICLGLMLLLAW